MAQPVEADQAQPPLIPNEAAWLHDHERMRVASRRVGRAIRLLTRRMAGNVTVGPTRVQALWNVQSRRVR